MPIRVLSFDFDGCIFNDRYVQAKGAEKSVIKCNQALLDELKGKNAEFSKTMVFVGSNRQSYYVDQHNAYMRGSCFPAIQRISNYLEAELDTFLLADIYGNRNAGDAFELAIQQVLKDKHPQASSDSDDDGEHPDTIFDIKKTTLLYAQIHKVAQAHPDEEIHFEFFDDRRDILTSLRQFFNTYPELIPRNVQLTLHQYEDEEIGYSCNFKGQGDIDGNYRQTVKDMAAIALYPRVFDDGIDIEIDIALFVTPEQLTRRQPLASPCVLVSQRNEIPSPQLRAQFARHLQSIENKAIQLEQDGFFIASQKARELQLALKNNSRLYFNRMMDKDDFNANCRDALATAREELEKHRGWKALLGNIALFIFTLGVGYVVGGMVNWAVNGNFMLFRPATDSAKKLAMVEAEIEQLIPNHPHVAS